MNELKFHRIFGQGATSTQAFTDQEYNRGWGFLGNEPPPYELFDDFFKNTDLKLKHLYDKQLEGNQALIAHNSATDAHSELLGRHNSDRTAHSAAFAEHNKSTSAHSDIRTKITNDINAHNTSTSAHKPIIDAIKAITGTSAFNTAPSKSIVEIINLLGMGGIVAAKLDANAGFIKFANGFAIQWGKLSEVNNPHVVTFPLQFKTSVFVVIPIDTNMATDPLIFGVDELTNRSFKINGRRINSLSKLWFRYIAIGV